ncbi:MAG: lysophospholipid acyltransferase family protein [Deltaproteobacteria bacterium]|nr:lysophospholipid acyltransferase family protein [Deltaproteobacteria bacterium]
MKRFLIPAIDLGLRISVAAANFLFRLLGWRFICVAGKCLGDAFYRLRSDKKRIVEEEIRLLFGPRFGAREAAAIAKNSFENHYMRHIETVFFGRLDKAMLDKVMRVDGIGHIDAALKKGKGVILLLSHFGSFLLPLPFLGYRGYKVNQITGKQEHRSVIGERIWLWRKSEADWLPVKYIQVGKFLRPLYEALEANEIVAVAFDGRNGTKWAEADFFERKAIFSTGPFELARRTGAAIIPTFTVRGKDNVHRLYIEPEFRLSDDPDTEKALKDDIKRFTSIFAGYIERHPAHFGMVLYTVKRDFETGAGKPLFVENVN